MKKILKQRVGYGMADMGCNLIWQMITLYLMYFYTDVYGLQAAQVGLLFLLTRCVDGVTDIVMGIIIDKTDTRWGQSRPYFLFGAIPFALLAILAFHVPDVGETAKLVYAYITYIGLSCAYTLVNIPLSSILPRLTSNYHERTVLVSFRMVFAAIGATAVSSLTMPLVNTLGGGDEAKGFFLTMTIFAVLAMFMFFYTFKNVEERVKVEQEKVKVKEAVKSVKGNTPWFISTINLAFVLGPTFLMSGALIYYFTYVIKNPALVGVVAGISTFIPILASLVIPFIVKKICKRDLMQIGGFVQIFGILIIFIAKTNVGLILLGAAIQAFGFGLRQNMAFSIGPDPIDYGEYISGVNAAGLLSSVNGFVVKVTLAICGAITSWLLATGGYVAGAEQTQTAMTAISMSYIVLPIISIAISIVLMNFYKLDKIYPQIRAELDQRVAEKNK